VSSAGLVCLAGVSGAGKDTAGLYLRERHGFERVAVADPLKEAVASLFGVSRRQLWGDERDTPDSRLGRTPRELYQWFGRACAEVDPEVWIRPFRTHVQEILSLGGRAVCTDLRTRDEFEVVRSLGGVVWLIERRGAGAPGAAATHSTETELALAERSLFASLIQNDGTVAELQASLDQALATA
jgi:hypothetical protein